jgi:hypothetical protein
MLSKADKIGSATQDHLLNFSSKTFTKTFSFFSKMRVNKHRIIVLCCFTWMLIGVFRKKGI